MDRRDLNRALALVVAISVSGCATHTIPVAIARSDRTASIYLIGDAGKATPDDGVLMALIADASAGPADRRIVFLGDNVYPSGLSSAAPGQTGKAKEEQDYLDAQVNVARQSNTHTIFVPGNHDWAKMGPEGWDYVKEAGKFITSKGEGWAQQLPAEGCPGPAHLDLGESLRLIFIDSQWWLQEASLPNQPYPNKPSEHTPNNCPVNTEAAVATALADLLRNTVRDGRHAIVMAHHPLNTKGPHGGRTSFWNHLFPLREVNRWLFVPIPTLGLFTRGMWSPQDLSNGTNRWMRRQLEDAMAEAPPLLFAAGHDHSLQVFRGPTARFSVVSGSGTIDHQTNIGWKPATLYASSAAGYMRVDVLQDQSIRLSVIEVTAPALAAAQAGGKPLYERREAASIWLSRPTGK